MIDGSVHHSLEEVKVDICKKKIKRAILAGLGLKYTRVSDASFGRFTLDLPGSPRTAGAARTIASDLGFYLRGRDHLSAPPDRSG